MQNLALAVSTEPVAPIAYMFDTFPEVMIVAEALMEGGTLQTRFII